MSDDQFNIRELMKSLGIKNNTSIAKRLNVSTSSISNYRCNNSRNHWFSEFLLLNQQLLETQEKLKVLEEKYNTLTEQYNKLQGYCYNNTDTNQKAPSLIDKILTDFHKIL